MNDAKKEKIFRSVYDLLVDEGYEGFTLSRVAENAGLSKSSILYHFDDKANLIDEFVLWLSESEVFNKTLADTPEEMIDVLIGEDTEVWDLRTAIVQCSFSQESELEEYSKLNERGRTLMTQVLREDGYENPEELADTILTYIIGLGYQVAAQNEDLDIERKNRQVKKFLLNQ